MTSYHAWVYKPDLAALIRRMVFDLPSAHDIHLRFKVYRIWETLSVLAAAFPAGRSSAADSENNDKISAVNTITNAGYSANTTSSHELLEIRAVSKDLVLPVMALENGIRGRITIHKNDTVSVILSCSESPITFNIERLVTLTCSLARLEERLRSLIDAALQQHQQDLYFLPSTTIATNGQQNSATVTATSSMTPSKIAANALIVREYSSWIVTMWHIGLDSLERYAGEKFEVAWKDFTGEWIRVYSKERLLVVGKPDANKTRKLKKKKKAKKQFVLRIERQEYPNDRLRSTVEHKLSSISVGIEGIRERGY